MHIVATAHDAPTPVYPREPRRSRAEHPKNICVEEQVDSALAKQDLIEGQQALDAPPEVLMIEGQPALPSTPDSNRQHTPHGLSKLAYLAFADDIVLISHTIADATRQLHALERAAKSVGLYLNFGKGKTERMTFGDFAEGPLSLAGGTPVPQVTSYKHLGVVLGEDWLSDLAARKRRAWCRKFRNISKSHVDDSTKRLLYEAIVFPFFALRRSNLADLAFVG